jgi:site-specific DNA recombinase
MKKGAKTAPALLINEVEAKVVRKIFELYATGKYGIGKICHWLEEHEIPTKTGNKFWRGCVVRLMLKNETYAGTRYYNKMFHLKESSDKKKTLKRGRVIVKARSEWIGIKVPTIVTKELFDQVQKVVQEKAKRYSQPMKSQLLSGLLYCGECGHAMSPYRRRVGAWLKIGIRRIYHKTAYLCTWRTLAKAHSKKAANPCNSPEIISSILEGKVFQMINDIMIDGVKLKTHMDFFKKDYRADQKKVEWKLTRLNKREKEIEKEKKRTMDAYVAGQITQQEYVDRNVKLDQELLKMKNKRNELFLTIPLLHKKEVVDMSMRQFCENAKMRLEKCHDYESRQKFLHDHIEKVIFQKDKVTLIGSVPIKTSDNEGGRIPFKIKDDFDKRKFHKKKRAKYLVDSRLKEWGSGGRNEKLFSTKSQELRSLASLASQITQQVL